MVIPHLALARQLPDGSRAVRTERVCLDFAVVNALGPDHWRRTLAGAGQAAEAYDAAKRRRHRTETRCREQGLAFTPVILKQPGGMSKTAYAVLRAIAAAVVGQEGRLSTAVRREMRHRLAIIRARTTASAITRRRQGDPPVQPWRAAMKAARILEEV